MTKVASSIQLQLFTVVAMSNAEGVYQSERDMVANEVYDADGKLVYVDCPGAHNKRFNKEIRRQEVQATSFSNALNVFKGKEPLNYLIKVPFPSRDKMPKSGIVRDKTSGLVTRFEFVERDCVPAKRYRMMDQNSPSNPVMPYDCVVKYYEMMK